MRALLMAGFLLCNPITIGVIGGVKWSRDYNASLATAYAERNFRSECPAYKQASTWDRWTNSRYTTISWCRDYLDRL